MVKDPSMTPRSRFLLAAALAVAALLAARRRARRAARPADLDRRHDAVGLYRPGAGVAHADIAAAGRGRRVGRRRHRRHADGDLSVAHDAHHRRRAGPARHLRQPHPRSREPLERRLVLVRPGHPGADAARGGPGPRSDGRRRHVAGVGRDGSRLQRAGVLGTSRHPEGVQLLQAPSARRARCSSRRSWPAARRSAGHRPIAIAPTSPASSCAPTRPT